MFSIIGIGFLFECRYFDYCVWNLFSSQNGRRIIKKIGSAKKHLFSYLHAISKTYGPNPRLLKRAYNTIIIPTLLHGCHAFGDQAQTKNIKAKLSSLNRLACLMMAPVAPTTGTTALEVLYDIMPLHCLIEQKASEIMARICDRIPVTWDGLGKLPNMGFFVSNDFNLWKENCHK